MNNILNKIKSKNGNIISSKINHLNESEKQSIEEKCSHWKNEYSLLDKVKILNKGYKTPPKCQLDGCDSHVGVSNTKTFTLMKGCCIEHSKLINSNNSKQNQKGNKKKQNLTENDKNFLKNKAEYYGYEIIDYPERLIYDPITFKCSNCNNMFQRKHYYLDKKFPYCTDCLNNKRHNELKLNIDHFYKIANKANVQILNDSINNTHDNLEIICKCGKQFKRLAYIFKNEELYYCNFCENGWNSKIENEIYEFLIDYVSNIEISNRTILNDKEIDLFLPDFNIGIEVNGIYWHSELRGKGRNYHINKTMESKEKGVSLVHITDTQWKKNQDTVKSLLLMKIGYIQKKYNARSLTIKEINYTEEKEFFDNNHIQHHRNSSIAYGLFDGNEMISCMSFLKHKNYWEILRFSTKNYCICRGAASRLFHHFEINNNPSKTISYSEVSLFPNGDENTVYYQLGFYYNGRSNPNYWYFPKNQPSTLFSRIKFQKHKLKGQLEHYDDSLSEWENMKLNDYDRYWDCGNWIFIKE